MIASTTPANAATSDTGSESQPGINRKKRTTRQAPARISIFVKVRPLDSLFPTSAASLTTRLLVQDWVTWATEGCSAQCSKPWPQE